MQRAREACSLRNFEGILQNVRPIVQNLIPQPTAERGVLHDDGLHAFGAGGDEADFGADLLGQEFDIATRVAGERIHFSRAEG